ncbi:hypothetical protein EHS13_14990 [Paenibacillus psychroresistens]|uniref:Uncharacterized protein n=1 Tax=Paenibacillus psychroresistens TaxID=1778678 RepID=A0A6B8RL43_9BACL|nr:hypothetical protein [Paenibacillus psychroresistens]QGQ96088.1 hypothetical protein EHS13_14990 [Paenibacillus psychroresistens]
MINSIENHLLTFKLNEEIGHEVLSSVQEMDPKMNMFFLTDRENLVSDGVVQELDVKGVFIVWNATYVIIDKRSDGTMLFDVHLANLLNVEPAIRKLLELNGFDVCDQSSLTVH